MNVDDQRCFNVDSTLMCLLGSVGHLFAATVYNGGPAPNIFSSWIYNYIIGDMNLLKEEVPQELSGSIFEDLYKKVGVYCCRFVLVLGQKV